MSKTKQAMPLDGLTIEVQVRRHYGRPLVYPVCTLSQGLIELTGLKTFTPKTLRHLETLGLDIDYVPESIDLTTLEAHSD